MCTVSQARRINGESDLRRAGGVTAGSTKALARSRDMLRENYDGSFVSYDWDRDRTSSASAPKRRGVGLSAGFGAIAQEASPTSLTQSS